MPSITNPFTALEAEMDWPFPQLFRFDGVTLLATRHYLYSVAADWSLTQLPTWFSSGDVWDGLDFGNFRVLTNSTVTIIVDVASGNYILASAADLPVCKTACNLRNQIIIGNTASGTNWVRWGAIGANEWTIDETNEAGERRMDWDGEVLRVKPLANSVIVYGDSGITVMEPVSKPLATFGFENLASYGIASRGAVGDSLGSHLFIDEAGVLRELTKQGIKRLGYQEFFAPMLGTDIVITYNQYEDEFYISNSISSYVYSNGNLGEMDEYVSGGAGFDGAFAGIKGAHNGTYRTLVSNPFNFNLNASKAITYVGLNSTASVGTQVALDWRNSPNSSFSRSPFVPLNLEGIGEVIVDAVEFRVVVRAPISQVPDFGGQVMVGWKSTDKRSKRGTYVSVKSED